MTKNFKKLKADTRYKYRNREGDIVTLIETGNARYPFECVSGRFNFTAEGDFYADDFLGSNPYDLIELIPDENGYFPHTPGDPMPVDGEAIIKVTSFGCGKAKFFNWSESGDITGYKIIEEKQMIKEDPELSAIQAVLDLPAEARARVMEYLNDRK